MEMEMDLAAALERLAALDEKRYTDADSVITEIGGWLDEIPPRAVPEALGVLGSAYRMNLDYGQAQENIELGLEFAYQVLDYATAGRLHQRLSMVWWNRMDYTRALDENSRAIACHEEAANRVGVARSMVDRGIIFLSQGHFQRSTNSYLRSLDELPETETERRNRFAAFMGIAHNLIEVGDIDAARPYLERAEEYKVIPQAVAQLQWNYGAALSLAGCHREACKKLWTSVQALENLAPVECALATIDFAKALIRAGQPHKACQAARMMHDCVGSLKHNEAAQAAAIELGLIGTRGTELTLTILENARVRVSQAQSGKA